eukprot:scaffold2545_cov100-Amphora_coffeaeformis.AAC.1
MAKLLDSAGDKVYNSLGEEFAWHSINVVQYQAVKHAYCIKELQLGKQENVQNMWAVAVTKTQGWHQEKNQLQGIHICQYLKA